MALPPSIPTSFVPHNPGGGPKHFRSDFSGAAGFFVYAILVITLALALGVFLYGKILSSQQQSKDNELAAAESKIDVGTVANFVRLRDRLELGQTLLDKHVAFSTFFASIGALLPTSVRFSALHISVDPSGVAKVDAAGVAKNFNALAVVSTAFANDGQIKDAIFSQISINGKDNSVSFALSATLDPKLIAFSPNAAAAIAPAAAGTGTSTATTTP